MSTTPVAPKQLLLVATRQIGDVLLATPLLRSIKQAWPQATIDVLVYAGKGGMLSGNPDCSNLIEIKERPSFTDNWQLAKRIFRRYDISVTVQTSDRGHLYAWIGGKKRFGLVPEKGGGWKRWSCHGYVPLDDEWTHTVIQNLKLAELMGIPAISEVVPTFIAGITTPTAIPVCLPSGPYAVIHPFPMWHYKRWTTPGWHSLISALRLRGLGVVITGGKNTEETAYCQELAAAFPQGVVDTSGQLSFAQVSQVIQGATLFVGPDTSVTHLAAACGTPTVALYGPTNPIKWGPWPSDRTFEEGNPYTKIGRPWQSVGNVLLLQGAGDCVPCHKEGCDRHRLSRSDCMETLKPDQVLMAVDSILISTSGRP